MSATRIRYLDGLRGVLAITVFLHHFIYAFAPEIIFGGEYEVFERTGPFTLAKIFALTPLNIIFSPTFGIIFFFILSGYVQSYKYFLKPEIKTLQSAFLKRYFRLAIPVLFVVILVFIFHKLNFISKTKIPANMLTKEWTASMLPNSLSFPAAVKHGLWDTFIERSHYYQVLWTMQTELYNSWLLLLILFVTHQLKVMPKLLFTWLMIQLLFLNTWYGAAFTIGSLFCYLDTQTEVMKKLSRSSFLLIILLVAGLYFSGFPFMAYEGAIKKSIYSPFAVFKKMSQVACCLAGVILLFLWVINHNGAKKFFANKILLSLGDISFMVYLIHLLIIFSFSPWLYTKLLYKMSLPANLVVTSTLTFGVVCLKSWLFTRYVDAPALRFANRSVKKMTG